jgi:hypothetical protein
MFVHALETCPFVVMGYVTLTLFFWYVVTCYIGSYMMDFYGPISIFIFFGALSFFGLIYIQIFVKDTTFKTVSAVAKDDNYSK